MLYTIIPDSFFFARNGKVLLQDPQTGLVVDLLPKQCLSKLFLVTEEKAGVPTTCFPSETPSMLLAMGVLGRFASNRKGVLSVNKARLLASEKPGSLLWGKEWSDLSFQALMGELASHVSVRGEPVLKLRIGGFPVFLQFQDKDYHSFIRQDVLVQAILALSVKPRELRGAPHIRRYIREDQAEA